MLLLGHAGLTLGTALLLECMLTKLPSPLNTTINHPSCAYSPKPPSISLLTKRIDYRLILLGSLLPDITDKIIGQLLFKNLFSNGRIFSHTFLFLILLTHVDSYLYRSHRNPSLLFLSFGVLIHLILDKMWLHPKTFLYPLYGWTFPRFNLDNWLSELLQALLDPAIYIPEIIGASIQNPSPLPQGRRLVI